MTGEGVSITGISNKDRKSKILAFFLLLICGIVFTILNPIYLAIWLLGAIIYFYPVKYANIKLIIFYSFALILGLIALQVTSNTRLGNNKSLLNLLPNRAVLELFFSGIFGLLLTQIIKIKPPSKWWISINNLGTKLAAFSYTLYLTHFPILMLLQYFGFPKNNKISWESMSWYFLEIIICILLAWAIYWLFEKRSQYIKNIIKVTFHVKY